MYQEIQLSSVSHTFHMCTENNYELLGFIIAIKCLICNFEIMQIKITITTQNVRHEGTDLSFLT